MLIFQSTDGLILEDIKTIGFFTFLSYIVYTFLKHVMYKRSVDAKLKNLKGPPSYPIIGSSLLFLGKKDIVGIIEKTMLDYESSRHPVPVWMGTDLVLFCSCPDDLKTILTSPYAFMKHDFYKFFRPIIGNGLVSAPVPVWKQHRKIISPLFNTRNLEKFVPKFKRMSDVLVNRLRLKAGNGAFDAYDIVAPCNVDFLSETLIGVRVNAQEDPQTINYVRAALKTMEIINHRIYQIWLHSDILYKISGWEKKQWDSVNLASVLRKRVLEVKLKEEPSNLTTKETQSKEGSSVLERLIEETKGDHKQKWSMEDVIEELDTLFITGTDTSATNVCFTLMMLGNFPEIQRKAVIELESIFGTSKRTIEAEDLKKLCYLDQIIKETLRLYPVAPFIGRQVTQEIELDHCTIPAGAGVMISIRGVHKDPRIWGKDVNNFDPDRFSPKRSEGRHPYAFIPFSIGPRNCIGLKYSNIATKYILATILRNFVVKCDTKIEDIRVKADIAMTAIDGYNISLEERLPAI